MQTALRRKLIMTRSLLALVFLGAGLAKVFNYPGTLASLRTEGVWISTLSLPVAILIELGGGLALAFGWNPRWTANLLAVYLVPVTWVYHDFWNALGLDRTLQITHFLKNLSIIGGILTYGLQSQVLNSFLGGTLVQLRKETFERRRVA